MCCKRRHNETKIHTKHARAYISLYNLYMRMRRLLMIASYFVDLATGLDTPAGVALLRRVKKVLDLPSSTMIPKPGNNVWKARPFSVFTVFFVSRDHHAASYRSVYTARSFRISPCTLYMRVWCMVDD